MWFRVSRVVGGCGVSLVRPSHDQECDRHCPTTAVLVSALLTAAIAACSPPAEVVRSEDLQVTRPDADAIVVVYSRTGNTARAAMAMAELLGADYVRLLGQPGDGDGYLSTPSAYDVVQIEPERIDLSPYRLVVLGTPIWYWRPTAHINTFIQSNDFDDKDVVLFFTYEGGVSEDALVEWQGLVQSRGGTVLDVFGIDRDELAEDETVSDRALSEARSRRDRWLAAETPEE